jgi:hypothetical protein
MKSDILNKLYPGIGDVNERISAEAVARANDLLRATNQLSGYAEVAFRQLAMSKALERV